MCSPLRSYRLTILFIASFVLANAQTSLVYTGNQRDGTISGFTIDPISGALTPVPGSPFSAQGTSTAWVTTDPLGQFVFAANEGDGNVAVYRIGVAGELTPVLGSPFTVGLRPFSMTIDPTGRFLYISTPYALKIYGFSINRSTGFLTPIGGSPFTTPYLASDLKVHPSGKFLFVEFADRGFAYPNTIFVYSIDPTTGAIVFASVAPGSFKPLVGLEVDPSGSFLYAAQQDGASSAIHAFTIDAGSGALSIISGSPFHFGTGSSLDAPYQIRTDPTGRFLFAPNRGLPGVFVYSIGLNGALTPTASSPTTTGPYPGPTTPGPTSIDVAFDPLGRFAYVVNYTDYTGIGNDVAGFAIADSGALLPVPGSPFVTARAPLSIASSTQILPAKFGIAAFSPSLGGNTGTVTMRVLGKSFQKGLQIKLAVAGKPDIFGANTSVLSSVYLTSSFDLTGASPGPRDIVVTDPEGDSAALLNGFTVIQGGRPEAWSDFIGRAALRAGYEQSYSLIVGNRGTIDLAATTVFIQLPQAIQWTLPPQQHFVQFSSGSNTVIAVFVGNLGAGTTTFIPLGLVGPVGSEFAHVPFSIATWVSGQ